MPECVVAALYHFAPLQDFAERRAGLQSLCDELGVRGSLLLASEGVNGTIAGPREGVDAVLSHIRGFPGFSRMVHKESLAERVPFYRMKVRLKKEIVTMGVPGVDPNDLVGTYVEPQDWNALISRDDVVVIDTRNDYEVEIGSFRGAVDPGTRTFREFPDWFRQFQRSHNKPKVAMFCTGGIRCEKSTAFAKSLGVDDVYHLKGGILKYLEEIPQERSLWDGQCFVFDQRVSVGHGLTPGDLSLCHACRRPLTAKDRASPHFREGVSCARCIDEFSEEDRVRFAERQRQVELSEARSANHIGQDLEAARAEAADAAEKAREASMSGRARRDDG